MTPHDSRPARPDDAHWIAELRAVVMRPDLERLQRYDPVRVRTRFLDAYRPELTRVLLVDGEEVGSVAVRPEPDAVWVEHFYITPHRQGRGLGSAVLAEILDRDTNGLPFRIDVLRGSSARRLYERAGFLWESEDPVDVVLVAPPGPRRAGATASA